MKKYLLASLSLIFTIPVFAYEDCIISTNGKLTDIKIQHNDVIDVFPLVTIKNDKNTLVVHPLKEGKTKFTVLKDNTNKFLFSVNITDEKTEVSKVEGFDILTLDCPPRAYEYYFDLDEPPEGVGVNQSEVKKFGANTSGINTTEDFDDEYIDELEEPPVLRGES